MSREGFFRIGVITALRSALGITPDESEALIISVRVWRKLAMCCLSSQVGTGSSWQDFVVDWLMILSRSSGLTVQKSDKIQSGCRAGFSKTSELTLRSSMLLRMFLTLSVKKLLNALVRVCGVSNIAGI